MIPPVTTTNIGAEEPATDQNEKDAPLNDPKECGRKGVRLTRVKKKLMA